MNPSHKIHILTNNKEKCLIYHTLLQPNESKASENFNFICNGWDLKIKLFFDTGKKAYFFLSFFSCL